MVMVRAQAVHAERAIPARRPAFPQGVCLLRAQLPQPTQSCGISCAQTAIIPTNNVIEASAAASSTNVLNMPSSSRWNIRRLLFFFFSCRQGAVVGQFEK